MLAPSSSPLSAIYNDSFTIRRQLSATPSPSTRSSKRLKGTVSTLQQREAPSTPTRSRTKMLSTQLTITTATSRTSPRQSTLLAATTSIKSTLTTTTAKASRSTTAKSASTQSKAGALTQTKLNLLPARIHCKTCGMSFTRTDATDCALHDDFHRAQLEGVPVPSRLFPNLASPTNGVQTGTVLPGGLIDTLRLGLCRNAEKSIVRRALEFVDLELASTLPALEARQYTAFLYRYKNRIVAVLLCEPRRRACKLLAGGELEGSQSSSSPPSTQSSAGEEERFPRPSSADSAQERTSEDGEEGSTRCAMGVSRMWTCKTYRRRGVMRELLDVARTRYLVGSTLRKAEIAYTQLSASGEAFLRSYVVDGAAGDTVPILVYSD